MIFLIIGIIVVVVMIDLLAVKSYNGLVVLKNRVVN